MKRVDFGRRIKEQRKLMGYTIEQFAEMIDASSRFVADIEAGKRGMAFDRLCLTAKVLHVSTDYLLLGVQQYADPSPVVRMLEACSETERNYAEELLRTFLAAMREKEAE